MDWLGELVKGGLTIISVAVGGTLAWRAGLNMRLEDEIRRAYADVGGAFETLYRASFRVERRWSLVEDNSARGSQFRESRGRSFNEGVALFADARLALDVALTKLLLLDRHTGRTKYVRSLLSAKGEMLDDKTVLALITNNKAFEDHMANVRQSFEEFRDNLPLHFTSLGHLFGSE